MEEFDSQSFLCGQVKRGNEETTRTQDDSDVRITLDSVTGELFEMDGWMFWA